MQTTAQRNAIRRALAHGGAAVVSRVRFGRYRVASASRPGSMHSVSVDEHGTYRCSCEAGKAGRPCWHAAAVYIAKVERASKGRVTGPAPAVAIPAPVPSNVVDIRTRQAA